MEATVNGGLNDVNGDDLHIQNNGTYGRICKLTQWGLVDLSDFISSPSGAWGGSTRSVGQRQRDTAGEGNRIGGTLHSPVRPCQCSGQ